MIITDISDEIDPPYPERIRSEADEMGLTRSGGLHLTPIIHSLEQSVKPRDEWCTEEELSFYAAGGFLWERVFAKCHAEAIENGDMFRPGEVEKDGIIGSPDLIYAPSWEIVETKHPWKSVNKFDYQFERYHWAWIVQVACYCYMIGSESAQIHAFFVNGNYKPPCPCTRSVRLGFSDTELRNYWGMITGHAKEMGWLV